MSGPHEARLGDVQARLTAIAEELADLALDVLRQAVSDGADKRPELEKRVTRARTAVEKAARLLDDLPQ
ncbi:MAG: hypothetical protein ACT4PW_06995 [Acidimicrobiia bacterium]